LDNKELNIDDILRELRGIIGEQAQQIAMYKVLLAQASKPKDSPSKEK